MPTTVGTGWASHNDPTLEDWRRRTLESAAYQSLHRLIGQAAAIESLSGKSAEVDSHKVAYYLRTEECFARSYSQWIALRSQEATLQLWYNAMSNVPSVYATQWADHDFEPIGMALDALFRSKGWMK